MVSLNNESKLDLAEKHSESAGMGLSIPVGFIAAAFVFTDSKKPTGGRGMDLLLGHQEKNHWLQCDQSGALHGNEPFRQCSSAVNI
jgi:hypothetical protein